jgi:hypothetical protein
MQRAAASAFDALVRIAQARGQMVGNNSTNEREYADHDASSTHITDCSGSRISDAFRMSQNNVIVFGLTYPFCIPIIIPLHLHVGSQTHAPFAHALDTKAMRDAFFSVHQVCDASV